MDRAAIEKFAVSARTQLISEVEQRLFELGLSRKNIASGSIPSSFELELTNGKLLCEDWKEKRERLVRELGDNRYDQVVEQTAYTWFNRFVAIRFMEVNGYLPSGIRVMSSAGADPKDARIKPDIMRHATSAPLHIDPDRARELRMAGDDEGLYKYLLMAQFRELSHALPFLFDTIEDWTELLFPRNMLSEGSVVRRMVAEIPEEDWLDHVEIVGWLYQYYISEKKDEVYGGFKKGKKATKDDIPSATQLFTPNWIVRYMVDNSLGRLWLESRPESKLREKMEYYIDEAEQDPKVRAELDKLTKKNIDPREITFIDPACGSGHILVYAFDLLYEMYLEAGYPASSIPTMILENNLYGLDIDERAVQLASFALLMRARSKDPQILSKGILPNVLAIEESNKISPGIIDLLVDSRVNPDKQEQQRQDLRYLLQVFKDAKEYGSLIRVDDVTFEWLPEAIAWAIEKAEGGRPGSPELDAPTIKQQMNAVSHLARQAKIMGGKYDVVVTNPPYMYRRNMNHTLKEYLKSTYGASGSDLFACFMEQCMHSTEASGFTAMITQHSWMFLSSLEGLRKTIVLDKTIYSMLHLGPRAFESIGGEVVQSTAFVVRNAQAPGYHGTYIRLVEFDTATEKIANLHNEANHYVFDTREAIRIPASPIAYWASGNVIRAFDEGTPLGEIAPPRQGMATSDNNRFLRLWHEVERADIGLNMGSRMEAEASSCRWFPYNKGGEFRKWYGNNEYLVNWEDDGDEIRNLRNKNGKLLSRPQNMDYYFLPGITWTDVSSSKLGVRYSPGGFLFDVKGSCLFPTNEDRCYILAFLCSNLAYHLAFMLNPSMSFQVGNMATLPVLFPSSPDIRTRIESLAEECIEIAKRDWDSFETSWHFRKHPFLVYGAGAGTIEEAFARWKEFADSEFSRMKQNEEEINRLFLEIYGLQDEMTPEVSDEDITVSRADRDRDVRSFISYAVGCMFGRYSLDVDGLVYAGRDFDWSKYETFIPEPDNVIPVLDDVYFPGDIVSRFVEFVKVCFGETHLDKNLDWIAKTLGKNSGETSKDTIRRYFVNDFYRDHTRMYKKRPIYWMFSSGRENGFKALMYMHRYRRDTVALVRTKYLLELTGRIDAAVKSLQRSIDSGNLGLTRSQAMKQLAKLERQLTELRQYDEHIHHLADRMIPIDLDDGVVVNYGQFKDVLEAIR
ncbi:MAG: BREX-1 system adenine-specific DNA-methyltransferase PglX [Firmicutes bacterium]|nr:BREX-1 system adenine-specific DNA-methyltransferase PglX [Bacillota bacterium]HXL03372.1 BREX-1 system adenine-specific DNA-methyltransferase PglX [Bacillota bacterium]